jgi:hypothetical protein
VVGDSEGESDSGMEVGNKVDELDNRWKLSQLDTVFLYFFLSM